MEKIMIMTPCSEHIHIDTAKCIFDLQKNVDGYELDFDFVRGYSVDRARNLCVHMARKAGANKILFVDSDMTFDPDFLNRLLRHDEEVVMGYYDHRIVDPDDQANRTNLCKLGRYCFDEQITVEEIREARDEGYDLIQTKGGGLGFCLIDLDIFNRFSYPWFDFVEYPDGGVLSEDLYFCLQCEVAGIPIYADTSCYCGHIFRMRHGGNKTVHVDM